MEGSLTINGSASDIELKNRTLEKAERGLMQQLLPLASGEEAASEDPAFGTISAKATSLFGALLRLMRVCLTAWPPKSKPP